jgi:hypothetical protein
MVSTPPRYASTNKVITVPPARALAKTRGFPITRSALGCHGNKEE